MAKVYSTTSDPLFYTHLFSNSNNNYVYLLVCFLCFRLLLLDYCHKLVFINDIISLIVIFDVMEHPQKQMIKFLLSLTTG